MRPFHLSFLLSLLVPGLVLGSNGKEEWNLKKSEISYVVTHPLHVVHGKSLSAKGKGVCYGGRGDFLVAVPVKSFDSGDQNRDLHMLEVTRAGDHPMIEVRVKIAEFNSASKPKRIVADLKVQFAGRTVEYPKVQLDALEWTSKGVRITGTIPLSLKAYGIQAPSLLTMPIQDAVPVKLDMSWERSGSK